MNEDRMKTNKELVFKIAKPILWFRTVASTFVVGACLSIPISALVLRVSLGAERWAEIFNAADSIKSSEVEALREELAITRAQLEEVQTLLGEVRGHEVKPRNPEKIGGQGGAPEPVVEPLDELLLRLQRINRTSRAPSGLNLSPALLVKQTPMGFPADGELTSEYGWRRSPFTGRSQLHGGIDISAPRSTIVSSTANGVVSQAGWRSGYGLSVVVDHGDGIETLYAHLSKVKVKPGSQISRGETLGQIGSSGNSTGPHLHYEVRQNGVPQNPERFTKLAELLREKLSNLRS